MRPIVEFCMSNLAAGTDWTKNKLEKDPGFDGDILEYGCLGNCGECFAYPFAIVNGDIVVGKTPKALLENIKKHIQKKQEDWAAIDKLLD